MKRSKTLLIISLLAISSIGIFHSINNYEMVEVNIFFDSVVDNKFLENLKAEINLEFRSFAGISARIPSIMIPTLDRAPFVKWEYNTEVTLLEDSIDWGVDRINAERVWGGSENAVDVTTGQCGSNVRVAVIDTGIDIDHPDLNVVGGYDYVNNDNNPDDDQGHGTHVAGTIAALDNDVTGSLVGVAPCVSLYAVKVLSASGSGTSAQVAAGIEWAGANNMDIASLSLGSSSPSTAIQQAGQYAASRGVLLVAASGNDGSSVGYPAAFSEFMAVGATSSSDTRASFSNYGSQLEVVAPGVSIRSTYPGNSYATLSGTSMATPHASGVAALVMGANPSLSANQVRNILQSTAEDLGSSGWDQFYGYGLVDAVAAVAAAGGGGGDTTPPSQVTGLTASAISSSEISLDWNDASDNVGVTSYNVYQDGSYLGSVTSSAATVTNLNPSTTYSYRVSAEDAAGNEGALSSSASATTLPSGGGGGDFVLRYESYDWDIAGEMDVFVNGFEVNWESYGLSGNNQLKTFNIDVSAYVSSANDFTVTFVDTYDNYNNDIRNVALIVDGSVYQTWQSNWIEPDGSGLTYSTGGGGSDTWSLSIYTYDWDISNEASIYVNGVELDWVSQGLGPDGGYKTFTFDISSIANSASSLTILLVDNYGSYTNYFTDLQIYRNGNLQVTLESSWVETPGSGVTYTYNL